MVDDVMAISFLCRVEMMEQLIRSSDLSVMQVEMDVYTALKKVRADTPLLHLVSSILLS